MKRIILFTGFAALLVAGTAWATHNTFTAKVFKVGNGNGLVVSSPSGIVCGDTCTASFSTSTLVKLTPFPGGSSSFGGWAGCVSVSGTVCTVHPIGPTSTSATAVATFNESD